MRFSKLGKYPGIIIACYEVKELSGKFTSSLTIVKSISVVNLLIMRKLGFALPKLNIRL